MASRYKETTSKWIKRHAQHDDADCLIWPFKRYVNGYGGTTIEGVETYAHRHMCRLAHGEPPTPNHEAAHSCGNGHLGCINPTHLSWKTHAENCADMELHGTLMRGEDNAMAKLTVDAVVEIRKMRGLASLAEMANKFGVTRSAIRAVLSGRSWRHVQGL